MDITLRKYLISNVQGSMSVNITYLGIEEKAFCITGINFKPRAAVIE
jgi:hypothetical protein